MMQVVQISPVPLPMIPQMLKDIEEDHTWKVIHILFFGHVQAPPPAIVAANTPAAAAVPAYALVLRCHDDTLPLPKTIAEKLSGPGAENE